MHLSRLVYYSTNVMMLRGEALAADLKQILTSAIRNNSERGVAGGLVFNRNHFLQVLEGDRATVTELFAHISEDPRHRHVVLVEVKPVSERLFGAWSMGYAGKTELFDELYARFGVSSKFDPASMSGDELVAFILELVSMEETAVSSRPHVAA
jgi:Sensors of blue-light using FAD